MNKELAIQKIRELCDNAELRIIKETDDVNVFGETWLRFYIHIMDVMGRSNTNKIDDILHYIKTDMGLVVVMDGNAVVVKWFDKI